MIFCDLNRELVEEVRKIGITAYNMDYFLTTYRTPRPVLMTASNPNWTFGGGLDAIFRGHFPELVKYKQFKGGDMERIANICFCITVDENLRATKEQVKKAIQFAVYNTDEDETLILSGVGTGIGGLSNSDFIKVLKEVVK